MREGGRPGAHLCIERSRPGGRMATLEPQPHRVGASLEVKDVEKLLGELEDRRQTPCAWHLDLSGTRHVQPLAGARLAAALRQMASEHLSVALPPDENGQRFRVLYRTGLLAAIAAHAEEVQGEGDELLARVEGDPQSYSTATNLIVFSRVDQGGLVGQKDRFARRLFGELAQHLPGVVRSLEASTQAALVEAGYEGIANIADHAFTKPFEGSPGRTALCLLSWHKEISAAAEDRLGLAAFIAGTRGRISPERLHWLQMTLIDD